MLLFSCINLDGQHETVADHWILQQWPGYTQGEK